MLQMREFRSGDQVWAATDLPIINIPDSDFGSHIPRGTRGQFSHYRKREGDGGKLAVVLFPNPKHSAAALVYYANPVQISSTAPQPTGGS